MSWRDILLVPSGLRPLSDHDTTFAAIPCAGDDRPVAGTGTLRALGNQRGAGRPLGGDPSLFRPEPTLDREGVQREVLMIRHLDVRRTAVEFGRFVSKSGHAALDRRVAVVRARMSAGLVLGRRAIRDCVIRQSPPGHGAVLQHLSCVGLSSSRRRLRHVGRRRGGCAERGQRHQEQGDKGGKRDCCHAVHRNSPGRGKPALCVTQDSQAHYFYDAKW